MSKRKAEGEPEETKESKSSKKPKLEHDPADMKARIKAVCKLAEKDLSGPTIRARQKATVMHLASEAAWDVCGLFCNLKVKNVTFLGDGMVGIDFVDKYFAGSFEPIKMLPDAYRNLRYFAAKKDGDELLFDKVSSADMIEYLTQLEFDANTELKMGAQDWSKIMQGRAGETDSDKAWRVVEHTFNLLRDTYKTSDKFQGIFDFAHFSDPASVLKERMTSWFA